MVITEVKTVLYRITKDMSFITMARGVNLIKNVGVNLLNLFVGYTILELWTHIVDNNEMVYLTKNPELITPQRFDEIDTRILFGHTL